MAYQEKRVIYRQQFETANYQTGEVNREFMEACYIILMVDPDDASVPVIPTNKQGIIRIPLAKYPGLQSSVEGFVPQFYMAFEQEYQEMIDNKLAAIEASKNKPLTPIE